MSALHSGQGLCDPSFQLSIRASQAVIELGAVTDVMHAALNAAHHANRQSDVTSRVAVALPGLHLHRGAARPGHEVVLFGSRSALEVYADLEGIRTLLRRGMIDTPEIVEVWSQPGETGTAYVRDRAVARRSPGAIRRARARAERRGISMPDAMETSRPDPACLALHYGDAVVHVREIAAELAAVPCFVSTYGFSAPGAPAVLPIRPDRAAGSIDDAA